MTDAQHLEERREPGKWVSIGLAALVHLALAVLLVFGIRWQNRAPDAVEVELYRAPAAPTAQRPPPPEPKPQPKPEPRVEPKPEPKPAPPPPKPDIAIKERPKPPPKETPKETPKPQPEPRRDLLREQLARETEQLNRQRMQMEAEREAAAIGASRASAAIARAKAAWADKIRKKIYDSIVMPPEGLGAANAKFLVSMLPDGSVLTVKRLKSTGNPAWDTAIERAINKSSPLPKPEDPSLFERELALDWSPEQ